MRRGSKRSATRQPPASGMTSAALSEYRPGKRPRPLESSRGAPAMVGISRRVKCDEHKRVLLARGQEKERRHVEEVRVGLGAGRRGNKSFDPLVQLLLAAGRDKSSLPSRVPRRVAGETTCAVIQVYTHVVVHASFESVRSCVSRATCSSCFILYS